MSLRDEIFEQPDVLQRLLSSQRSDVERIAHALSGRVDFALIAARGSSDHAALYAKYLWGATCGLPVGLAAPSLFTLYRRPPRLGRALTVGISQSGESPDVVAVIREARRQGAATLAITNSRGSPLAAAAELVLAVGAGEERAVAATKSYTSELMAVAMLAAALARDAALWQALAAVPQAVATTLGLEPHVAALAPRYAGMQRCVVLGRGFNYASAFEVALKLKELTYVVAEPYSFADFEHGPVAMVEPGFPVVCVAPDGQAAAAAGPLLTLLTRELDADLVVISDRQDFLDLAAAPLPLRMPAALPEALSPIVAVIPGQLLAYHLARARGYDPDAPRRLRKVTRTL